MIFKVDLVTRIDWRTELCREASTLILADSQAAKLARSRQHLASVYHITKLIAYASQAATNMAWQCVKGFDGLRRDQIFAP
jgi:hypothetical protein